MEMALSFSRKWAKLAKFFQGRTQHNIKNRFISIMVKFLKVSRKELAEMMKNQNLEEKIVSCLENLKLKGKKSTQCTRKKKEKVKQLNKNPEKGCDSICQQSPTQQSPTLKDLENALQFQDEVDFFKY